MRWKSAARLARLGVEVVMSLVASIVYVLLFAGFWFLIAWAAIQNPRGAVTVVAVAVGMVAAIFVALFVLMGATWVLAFTIALPRALWDALRAAVSAFVRSIRTGLR